MPRFEIRTSTGKELVVARFDADVPPGDGLATAKLHRDKCKERRLDPGKHSLWAWNQVMGWQACRSQA
jgi:hypothetical protein